MPVPPTKEDPAPGSGTPASPQRLEGTPYRLFDTLGEGATGMVYRGEHEELASAVVIKLLHFMVDDAPDMADRMRLEAQALARLSHPNLVRVIDYGVSAGRPFFVMEDEGGRTLADELQTRGALPLPEVLELAQQLLTGLAYIHREGLAHRDVKPSNILLSSQAQGRTTLKLIDFGVLKIVSEGDHALTPLAHPTETGTSLGTPSYLSPEQASGGKTDLRSDIYSAAMVIYEMLCGRAPFAHHQEIAQLLVAQLHERPRPPSHWAPWSVPAAIDKVTLHGMAKSPWDRFDSATAFAKALTTAAEEPQDEPADERDGRPGSLPPPEATEATEAADISPKWAHTEIMDAPGATEPRGPDQPAEPATARRASGFTTSEPEDPSEAPTEALEPVVPSVLAPVSTGAGAALRTVSLSALAFMLITMLLLFLLRVGGRLP